MNTIDLPWVARTERLKSKTDASVWDSVQYCHLPEPGHYILRRHPELGLVRVKYTDDARYESYRHRKGRYVEFTYRGVEFKIERNSQCAFLYMNGAQVSNADQFLHHIQEADVAEVFRMFLEDLWLSIREREQERDAELRQAREAQVAEGLAKLRAYQSDAKPRKALSWYKEIFSLWRK